MKSHNRFEARRAQVEREILTPPFPEDVEHYEGGTWSCSAASFALMSRSFKRFGFELDRAWSFDTLYERFSFIMRAACSMPSLGSVALGERHTIEMVEYLRAVQARDDSRIGPALSAVLAQSLEQPVQPAAQPNIRLISG